MCYKCANLITWVSVLAAVVCTVESRRPVIRAAPTAIKTGNHVVVLRRNTTAETLHHFLARAAKLSDDATVHRYVETVAKAFTIKLSPYSLEVLRRWPEVDYIEEEHMASGTQSTKIPWGMDRIDQRSRTLDYFYQPIATGAGVDVYIVDCGINYYHEEFENRAIYAGYDAVDVYQGLSGTIKARKGMDCFGHGTHVASLCGGKTYGSAKAVRLLSLRVLDCTNSAPWSVVLDALDYIARVAPQSARRAIVSMSLSGNYFKAVNDAVQHLYSLGIPVIVAASNGGLDACSQSPASSQYAITVGGTRNGDGLYVDTSFGSCVTLLSPGQNILGADYTCNNCSKYLSGTSMATPIVSGVAAMLLQREPSLTPANLKAKLVSTATVGAINFSDMPAQYRNITPNKLVYIPGSCGGIYDALGKGQISSPNYPDPYPGKISCVWTIMGLAKVQVQLNVTFVNLEAPSDTLKVCSQPSCSGSNLLATLTGNLGNTSLLYFAPSTGTSLWISLQINSTNSANRKGFKASFIKYYAGTTITVPNNNGFPTTPPLGTALPVDTQIFIEVDGADIAYVISEMARRGYKVVSLSSYRFGYNLETNFDVTFSNSSLVDTVPYIQLTECQLLAQIDGLRGQGYSVVSISGRVAANGLLYYTGVFRISAPIMETKVYLRDSVSGHLQRLVDLKASGYQLVAQSLETVGHVVEACSIYTRDIRLDYNISINTKPLDWTSFFNASFYQFTGNLLRAVSRYNPIHVDMYYGADNRSSLFSAVLLGYTQSQWFLWGLNYSSTLAEVASMKQYWEPIISLGYSYLGSAVHYVQWQQKSPPEYVMNIVKPKSVPTLITGPPQTAVSCPPSRTTNYTSPPQTTVPNSATSPPQATVHQTPTTTVSPPQTTVPNSATYPPQATVHQTPTTATVPPHQTTQQTVPPLTTVSPTQTVTSGTPQCCIDMQLQSKVDGKVIESVVSNMIQKGYKVVSIASYHSGPNLRANFDVLFSNSSLVDTVVYVQITEGQLLTMINDLRSDGYSLWSISERVRNFGNIPYYSGVFGKNAATVETKVYLRDNIATFQSRLVDMQVKGYQLVAQSVEKIGQVLEACSIYRRDSNSTNTKPQAWQSIFNVSYSIFVTMNMTSNLVPIYIDTYYLNYDGKAFFSAVLLERAPGNQAQWFQWGLSSNSIMNLVNAQRPTWVPIFSLGYIYAADTAHYLQWQRK